MNPGQSLAAVIFDLDGTLVDSERHGHRVAFNLAFAEAGLDYHWDEELYGQLLRTTGGQRRIAGFLASRGFEPDAIDDTAASLHKRKTAIMQELVAGGRVGPRPGVVRLLRELTGVGVRLAVATTGSRAWVSDLLTQVLGAIEFEVVVCGDEVRQRKPDPEAFVEALDRMGLDSTEVVVVEDSGEGLEAARAAGLATVVVVNGYTRDHDLGAAHLVLDGFGEPSQPASVLVDRVSSGCSGIVDAATLRAVLRGSLAAVDTR